MSDLKTVVAIAHIIRAYKYIFNLVSKSHPVMQLRINHLSSHFSQNISILQHSYTYPYASLNVCAFSPGRVFSSTGSFGNRCLCCAFYFFFCEHARAKCIEAFSGCSIFEAPSSGMQNREGFFYPESRKKILRPSLQMRASR